MLGVGYDADIRDALNAKRREPHIMDINCLEMGTTCDQIVSGNSTDELVRAVKGHMRLAHGYTDTQLESYPLLEMVVGAIWQSSRPPELRTPRPEL